MTQIHGVEIYQEKEWRDEIVRGGLDYIIQNLQPMHGADRAHPNIFQKYLLLFRRLSENSSDSVSFLFSISHITCTSSYSQALTSRPSFTNPAPNIPKHSFTIESISRNFRSKRNQRYQQTNGIRPISSTIGIENSNYIFSSYLIWVRSGRK